MPALFPLLVVALSCLQAPAAPPQGAPPGPPNGPPNGPPPGPPPRARGLALNTPDATPGYTLIAPLRSNTIRLVDLAGEVVHEWKSGYAPGSEYFLDDGTLLRCSKEPGIQRFKAGGQCGRLEQLAWDGSVVWSWKYATEEHVQHHDLQRTPDGTLLFIAWEWKSRADAIAAGRHPAYVGVQGIWSDAIYEIEPQGKDGAEVIWEWHAWDHLIQDIDPEAANYGNVAEHPERFDLNADLRRELPSDADVAELQKLGYIDAKPTQADLGADWLHTNGIHFDAEHDQIVLSSPHLNEVWIIDHATTSDEAAGTSGGQQGKGGDLLWRWGNPRNYGAGSGADQKLFGQHNPRIIPKGLPGAGHLLIFNNGGGRPDGNYSEVVELELPRNASGGLELAPFVAAAPAKPSWRYVAKEKGDFFSGFISGAQRLTNGHTLICEGASGRVFEVKQDGTMVWEYLHPFLDPVDPANGQPMPPGAEYGLFRATRIPATHPGLKGKALAPSKS